MTDPLRAELQRIAQGSGADSASARIALSDGRVRERLEAAMRTLAAHRGPDSSTCPSDAARAVGDEDGWRALMDDARAIARELATAGVVEITQRGKVVDPGAEWRGPIRIRIRT
ncbi:hypothetical protein MPNTM1_04035 [Mycolicibacterium parafortuitum]|uniref:DUF3253 domain-containing protein n=1 Tax=Mycolicibacterium parafortuitum TaxID=39692 RepID=UPI000CF2B2E6|nr:DUF3253 domain-containing protein [Mycobacterium sp. EPG1]